MELIHHATRLGFAVYRDLYIAYFQRLAEPWTHGGATNKNIRPARVPREIGPEVSEGVRPLFFGYEGDSAVRPRGGVPFEPAFNGYGRRIDKDQRKALRLFDGDRCDDHCVVPIFYSCTLISPDSTPQVFCIQWPSFLKEQNI